MVGNRAAPDAAKATSIRDYYEAYWREGLLVDNAFERWKLARVAAHVDALRPASIVDLGCGDGRVLSALGARARQGGAAMRLVGVDLSAEAVAAARARGLDAAVADIDGGRLPLEDGAFDVALCLDVLEHLFAPTRLLAEIRRVLRPGGHLVLTVPNAFNAFNRLAYLLGRHVDVMDKAHVTGEPFSEHIRFFSRALLDALLADGGFTPRRREFFFPERFTDARFAPAAHLAKAITWPRLHERAPSLFALEFLYVCARD